MPAEITGKDIDRPLIDAVAARERPYVILLDVMIRGVAKITLTENGSCV